MVVVQLPDDLKKIMKRRIQGNSDAETWDKREKVEISRVFAELRVLVWLG